MLCSAPVQTEEHVRVAQPEVDEDQREHRAIVGVSSHPTSRPSQRLTPNVLLSSAPPDERGHERRQGVGDDDQRAVDLAAAHALVVEHHRQAEADGERDEHRAAAAKTMFHEQDAHEGAPEWRRREDLGVVGEPDPTRKPGLSRDPSSAVNGPLDRAVDGAGVEIGDRVRRRRRTTRVGPASVAVPPGDADLAPVRGRHGEVAGVGRVPGQGVESPGRTPCRSPTLTMKVRWVVVSTWSSASPASSETTSSAVPRKISSVSGS